MKLALTDSSMSKNVQLDEVDEKILWELVIDARISNNALAERISVSPSTSSARMAALKANKVLVSSHAQVDYAAVGLHIQAIVFVRLRPQARAEIRKYANRAILLPNVINIFFLGGADDFLIHVACTSTEQLRDFVATQLSMDPAVASTQTQIIFEHLIGAQYANTLGGLDDMRQPLS